jgi:hypothetical protein
MAKTQTRFVTVGNASMSDTGPSSAATAAARTALAARMAGGPDNTVPRSAPIDKDRSAVIDQGLVIGRAVR